MKKNYLSSGDSYFADADEDFVLEEELKDTKRSFYYAQYLKDPFYDDVEEILQVQGPPLHNQHDIDINELKKISHYRERPKKSVTFSPGAEIIPVEWKPIENPMEKEVGVNDDQEIISKETRKKPKPMMVASGLMTFRHNEEDSSESSSEIWSPNPNPDEHLQNLIDGYDGFHVDVDQFTIKLPLEAMSYITQFLVTTKLQFTNDYPMLKKCMHIANCGVACLYLNPEDSSTPEMKVDLDTFSVYVRAAMKDKGFHFLSAKDPHIIGQTMLKMSTTQFIEILEDLNITHFWISAHGQKWAITDFEKFYGRIHGNEYWYDGDVNQLPHEPSELNHFDLGVNFYTRKKEIILFSYRYHPFENFFQTCASVAPQLSKPGTLAFILSSNFNFRRWIWLFDVTQPF